MAEYQPAYQHRGLLNDPEKGWYEERQEKTGGFMKVITCGTNAAVLESLLYKVKGKLFKCADQAGYYKLFINDPFREEGKYFPLERKECQ